MKKAIFYKEWIKTRRYFPIALTVSVIFIIYALLGVQRVINFRGVAHLWEILLSREAFRERMDALKGQLSSFEANVLRLYLNGLSYSEIAAEVKE